MLKLWGRKTSSNVQKVMWLLDEMETDYERVDAGGEFGIVDSPEYGKLNPNRKVPVLQDGDLTLYESHAILRYLSQRQCSPLLSDDLRERATTDQWMDWNATTLAPPLMGVFFQTVRLPLVQRDSGILKSHLESLHRAMRILDQRLAESQWLAGQTFSVGDIPAGTLMYRYFEMEIAREKLSNVSRWYNQLQQRPPYREIVMTSFESLRYR